MTYDVEKEMVLKIGVMPVIDYLQENHIWVDPDGDMDPMELLNYTAQIVQAKEVPKEDILNWLNPIKIIAADIYGSGVPSDTLEDTEADTSNEINKDSLDVIGKICGFQSWPVTEQGNGPFTSDISQNNVGSLSGIITRSPIDQYGDITISPPVNSPMDNHVALLDMIGLSEPDVDLITEDDINPEVLGDLVGQYIKLYKDKPIDLVGPVYHRIQFMKEDMPQPLSTGAVLALAKEFTDLGFFTDVTTSPFTGVENNVIHIGLMFTVIHSEHELIIHL